MLFGEILTQKYLIKIPYINKGIEFIDLLSKVRDKYAVSSSHTFFLNTELPIIYYEYN